MTETGGEKDTTTDDAADSSYNPIFRAIKAGGRRRGLKLERCFWDALQTISKRSGRSLTQIIEDLEEDGRKAAIPSLPGNLTSALRVFALTTLQKSESRLLHKASLDSLRIVLGACPTPAFALALTKPDRYFNPAFIRYLRTTLPGAASDTVERSLRLQIDMPLADLKRELDENATGTVELGFAIGVDERRVRGRLRAVTAPSADDAVIGYVIQ
ncbi:MAG: ribbon-helix-helix domain-containing protein [Pseudomonadota bacterium]